MSKRPSDDLFMVELFLKELSDQVKNLNKALIALESNPQEAKQLEIIMRAAHSIKGAARIVEFENIENLAHRLEDLFQESQQNKIRLIPEQFDLFFEVSDFFKSLSNIEKDKAKTWISSKKEIIESLLARFDASSFASENKKSIETYSDLNESSATLPLDQKLGSEKVWISSDLLKDFVHFSAEAVVVSKKIQTVSAGIISLKNTQNKLISLCDDMQRYAIERTSIVELRDLLKNMSDAASDSLYKVTSFYENLQTASARNLNLAGKVYEIGLSGYMNEFSEAIEFVPRLLRDLQRVTDKKINFISSGESVLVDRGILRAIEVPLTHIIRNACDHGIELADIRQKNGKAGVATISVSAENKFGMLIVRVRDDGCGLDSKKIKEAIVNKNLASVEDLNEASVEKIYDYLFYPGFSTSKNISSLSGRGVGLDIVRDFTNTFGGSSHIHSELGKYTEIVIKIPIARSFFKAMHVRSHGQSFAIALDQIKSLLHIKKASLVFKNSKIYTQLGEDLLEVIWLSNILGESETLKDLNDIQDRLYAFVFNLANTNYVIVVDELLDVEELLIRPMDSRLGKVPFVAGVSLTDKGLCALILDLDEIGRAIDWINKHSSTFLNAVKVLKSHYEKIKKSVLVVDDSAASRESLKLILEGIGVEVSVAQLVKEAWEMMEAKNYDLIVTDLNMPEANGIVLISQMRSQEEYLNIPVVVVSSDFTKEIRQECLDIGACAFFDKKDIAADIFSNEILKMLSSS